MGFGAMKPSTKKVAILNAAGYVGMSLYQCLLKHPYVEIVAVSSRSFAGSTVDQIAPELSGIAEQTFVPELVPGKMPLDVLFNCSEHGAAATRLAAWLEAGFEGQIIDLSADFRLSDVSNYQSYYDWIHPHPELSNRFSYGLCEITQPNLNTPLIANPGCFATGIALACFPIAKLIPDISLKVTALTGASGSGARPKPATHYPIRDNSVSTYKVFEHQHLPEILQVLPGSPGLSFVPASGPWSRGIWGTVQFDLPEDVSTDDIEQAFEQAYHKQALVRLRGRRLPVLREVVSTPFCDLGWTIKGRQGVVGFAIDNLLKGAASQAVQNLNRINGWPETTGLLSQH